MISKRSNKWCIGDVVGGAIDKGWWAFAGALGGVAASHVSWSPARLRVLT